MKMVSSPVPVTNTNLPTVLPLAPNNNSNNSNNSISNNTNNNGSPSNNNNNGLLSLDHYRLQLYNYAMAERIRCAQYSQPMPQVCSNYPAAVAAAAAAMSPYGPRLALSMSLFHNRVFQPEEPKPQHSYIGLIAMAILSSPETKLVLSDIYQYILDNWPYFRHRGMYINTFMLGFKQSRHFIFNLLFHSKSLNSKLIHGSWREYYIDLILCENFYSNRYTFTHVRHISDNFFYCFTRFSFFFHC